MAISTYLALVTAIFASLVVYLRDPANVQTFKSRVMAPLLGSGALGWRGYLAPDMFKHADLIDGEDFGNKGCYVVPDFAGCEDAQIHYGTSTAFLACTTAEDRFAFWPPLHLFSNKTRNNDYVITYDLKTDSIVRLKATGVEGDLIFHGFGMYSTPGSDTVYLQMVNHKHSPQSCISIFSHKLGSDTMEHIETNCDASMTEPNDVQPTGPTSFYFTNMRKFNGRGEQGLTAALQWVEDELGPWAWSNVVYCEGIGKCREVAGGMVGANGIMRAKDLLYVNNYLGSHVAVFKIDDKTHDLTRVETIRLGSPCDNLSYDPNADALLVAQFPDLRIAFQSVANPSMNVPISITRLKRISETTHIASIVFFAKDLTGAISIAVSDLQTGKSLIGGIINQGIVVCPRALAAEDGPIPA